MLRSAVFRSCLYVGCLNHFSHVLIPDVQNLFRATDPSNKSRLELQPRIGSCAERKYQVWPYPHHGCTAAQFQNKRNVWRLWLDTPCSEKVEHRAPQSTRSNAFVKPKLNFCRGTNLRCCSSGWPLSRHGCIRCPCPKFFFFLPAPFLQSAAVGSNPSRSLLGAEREPARLLWVRELEQLRPFVCAGLGGAAPDVAKQGWCNRYPLGAAQHAPPPALPASPAGVT